MKPTPGIKPAAPLRNSLSTVMPPPPPNMRLSSASIGANFAIFAAEPGPSILKYLTLGRAIGDFRERLRRQFCVMVHRYMGCLLDDDRNVAVIAERDVKVDDGFCAVVHGGRGEGHQGCGVIGSELAGLLDGGFEAVGGDADDQGQGVRKFIGDDLDSFEAFVIAEFVGFAGEPVDADGVDAAVHLKAQHLAQTGRVDVALVRERREENGGDTLLAFCSPSCVFRRSCKGATDLTAARRQRKGQPRSRKIMNLLG